MGIKRLLIALAVILFVLGSIVVLLFQGGADEALINTILPQIERRLGLKVSYEAVDTSLTSLALEKVEVRRKTDDALLVTASQLSIGIRVGPLFFGELDVTGIRIDDLEARVGDGPDRATLGDWTELASRLRGKSAAGRSGGSGETPEIHVASARVSYVDGAIAVDADKISGRVGVDRKAVIDIGSLEIRHGDAKIVQGDTIEVQYSPTNRSLTLRAREPSIDLDAQREPLLALLRDLGRAARNIEDASRDLSAEGGDAGTGAAVRAADAPFELNVFVSESAATLKLAGKGHQLAIDKISADVSKKLGGPLVARAAGQLPGTDARWNARLSIPPGDNPTLELEVPDMPLKEAGKLFTDSEHVIWSDAFADGTVSVELVDGGQEIVVTGQAAISNLTLQHPRIASTPLEELSFHADFKLSYDRREGAIQMERFQVSRGLARGILRGRIALDRTAFDVSLNVPEVVCQQLLNAFPLPLKERLEGVRLDGRFALDARVVVVEEDPEATVVEANLDNQCRLSELGSLPQPNYFRGPFSYVTYTDQKQDLRLITGLGTDRWTPLQFISPFVIEALLTTEDGKFWRHKGITLPEVRRAIEINLKKGSLKFGASTITMQLAKNLFLTRERTISRKLQELFLVWYLESNFTKEEILELYLNVVEFGPSVYGIRAAAGHYFGRDPIELNIMESVFLIRLLPSPVARHRTTYARGELSERQLKNLHRVVRTMGERKRLTDAELATALTEEIIFHEEGTPRPDARPPARRSDSLPAPDEELDPTGGATIVEEPEWEATP